MNERLERFTDLMKQVFELDKSDLDFGIYRIMNIRKDEIERFLTEGLPSKVRDTLAPFASGNKAEIEAQIAEIEKNARDFGMDASALPESNPMGKKYRELKKQLAEAIESIHNEFFNGTGIEILPFSSITREGKDELWNKIFDAIK